MQYDTGRPQNTLPAGLVVENPLVNLGYKDARAGMYLFDIQKMYPDSQVEEARSEWRDIRYLRYKDDAFVYYYVAVSEYGDAAILYITPAMVSDTVQEKEPQEEQLKEQEKQLCDRKEELQLLQLKNNLMELVEKKGNDSMSEPREYELPRALIILTQNENRGSMEVLVGMNFAQIQEALHETEIQDGFMYFEDGTVYYIQYEDACYAYTFVSDYEDGRESWLIIDKKM